MTIKDYIQTIVTELWPAIPADGDTPEIPGTQSHYARNYEFNISADNAAAEVVVCIEPDQQFLNLSPLTGNVNDGYNLFIRFLQLIPSIGTGEQAPTRVQAITDQKAKAAEFLVRLSTDDKFIDLPAKIPVIPVIEAYDANYFGVEINLQNLQVLIPFDICID